MIALHYLSSSTAPDRLLLVMLPGAGIAAAEFVEHGMVAAVQEGPQAIDVIVVQPGLEHYLDGGIADLLRQKIIEPARADGYARIWLLGISLGAMGALLTAAAHPDDIEGLVLLAPFLGTKGTIAELEASGGLAGWCADSSAATDTERVMLVWLQDFVARRPSPHALYLGYGETDRFAPGHRLLAQHLPSKRVVATKGGHDWASWMEIFEHLLSAAPFNTRQKLDDTGAPRIP